MLVLFGRGAAGGVPRAARAQTTAAGDASATADAAIKRGIDLRRTGRDEDALIEFQRAQDTAPTPRSAAQLGMCFQAMGRWVDAESFLERALDAKTDAWVNKNHDTLVRSLETAKAHIGRVEISGEPAGAEVLIGGRAAGVLPLARPVHVEAGQVDVTVRAPGYARATRTLTIVPGQYQRLDIALERVTGPVPVAPAQTSESSAVTAQAAAANESAPVYKRPWFWIATGVGVVAVAVVVAVLAQPKRYPDAAGTVTFP